MFGNKFYLLLLMVLLVQGALAHCDDNQININFASKSELKKLDGIGEVLAERIIDARPFDSLNDLIEVERIGEGTLEKIKDQGLACVSDEDNKEKDEIENEKQEDKNHTVTILNRGKDSRNVTLNEISLSGKTIKSDSSNVSLDKGDYAKYGFVGFCILLGFLLVLRKENKNEFRD